MPAPPKVRNLPDDQPDAVAPQTVQDDATPAYVTPSAAAPAGGAPANSKDPMDTLRAFLDSQKPAAAPSPTPPRPIDPSVFQMAQQNMMLASAASRMGIHTPNWFEIQHGGKPIDTDPEGTEMLQKAAQMPLQAAQMQRGMDVETAKVLNDFAEKNANRENAFDVGKMHAGAAAAMLPVKSAQEVATANAKIPGEVNKATQIAEATAPTKVDVAAKSAAATAGTKVDVAGRSAEATLPSKIALQDSAQINKQNNQPPEATVNMGRLATNALDASAQARAMLDDSKTTWDKGFTAHIPGTSYQIGTDEAKKFQTLMGLAYSQLTQSDEVRRTVSNINEALGRTTVVPGDSYGVAKFKLDNFDKIMTRLQHTIAVNHPAWSLLPGNEDYGKYVTPEMKDAALKTPAQRLREPSPAFDPDAFLGARK